MLEYVTFTLAQRSYAIDIMRIREVRELVDVTDIPGEGEDFAGVLTVRDRVIPVFDLRRMFGINDTEPTEDEAIIIVKSDDDRIGYVVDSVTDIERIAENQTMNADSYTNTQSEGFIEAVFTSDDNVTMIIDVERILDGKVSRQPGETQTEAA